MRHKRKINASYAGHHNFNGQHFIARRQTTLLGEFRPATCCQKWGGGGKTEGYQEVKRANVVKTSGLLYKQGVGFLRPEIRSLVKSIKRAESGAGETERAKRVGRLYREYVDSRTYQQWTSTDTWVRSWRWRPYVRNRCPLRRACSSAAPRGDPCTARGPQRQLPPPRPGCDALLESCTGNCYYCGRCVGYNRTSWPVRPYLYPCHSGNLEMWYCDGSGRSFVWTPRGSRSRYWRCCSPWFGRARRAVSWAGWQGRPLGQSWRNLPPHPRPRWEDSADCPPRPCWNRRSSLDTKSAFDVVGDPVYRLKCCSKYHNPLLSSLFTGFSLTTIYPWAHSLDVLPRCQPLYTQVPLQHKSRWDRDL